MSDEKAAAADQFAEAFAQAFAEVLFAEAESCKWFRVREVAEASRPKRRRKDKKEVRR